MPGPFTPAYSVGTPPVLSDTQGIGGNSYAGSVNQPDVNWLGTIATQLAAHEANVVNAHAFGASWLEKYLIRARSRAGIPVGQASYFYEDFLDVSRWLKALGVASLGAVATALGGVGQIDAIAADAVSYFNGDAVLGSPTVALGRGRWYFAARLALGAAIPAGSTAIAGLTTTAGGSALAGYVGPTNAAHYSAFIGDGVNPTEPLISTIHVDAAMHDLEMWCDSVNYYFAVDGETPVMLAPTNPPTDEGHPLLFVIAGVGINTVANYDKYLGVFPQAA